jgi:hypothetical protein
VRIRVRRIRLTAVRFAILRVIFLAEGVLAMFKTPFSNAPPREARLSPPTGIGWNVLNPRVRDRH